MQGRVTKRVVLWFALAASCLSPLVTAGEPMQVGAAIHFANRDVNLPQIHRMVKDARLTSWRTSLVWAAIEQQKGRYQPPPAYARVMDEARKAHELGLRPLIVLAYGNALYEAGGLVTTDEAREGFANYVRWVATQLKGSVRDYEIWNEWNIGFGSTDTPHKIGSVEDYAKLARVAAEAIHDIDPHAIVIAGGATNEDTEWFDAFAHSGVLSAIDGVSIHPYDYGKPWWGHTPEASLNWVGRIEQMMAKASGHPVGMYITEIGWPTNTRGYEEDTVADYLTRYMTLAKASSYVRGIWWYDLQDDGTDPDNREHHFGLFDREGKPKPAAIRMAEFNR